MSGRHHAREFSPRRFIGGLLGLVRNAAVASTIWLSNHRSLHGLDIVDFTRDGLESDDFERVEAALELIHAHDPVRFARIRRDVRRVLIAPMFGPAGEYWPHARAVVVGVAHVRNHVPLSLAMTIVHEAAHARLDARGVNQAESPGRVETFCVGQEVAFARRVPGSSELITGAYRKLETRYWESRFGERAASGRLRSVGAPKWLRKILRWAQQ